MSFGSIIEGRFKAEFAGRIIAVISGALLTVTLARVLDPTGYGLLYLALSVLGVMQIVSKLGIAKSAARYVAEYKEKDKSNISGILKYSLSLNIFTISASSILLILIHERLALFLGEENITPLLLIGVVFLVSSTLAKYVRHVLQGFENIKLSAIINAVDHISRLIFAVGLVIIGYGAIGGLVGYIIGHTLAALIGLGYLYREYYNHQAKRIAPDLRRRIAEYAVPLTASSTANVLDKRIDTVLVGIFTGSVGVAYYTIGKQITRFIETPISALGFTLSPSYESLRAASGVQKVREIYTQSIIIGLLFYIPAAVGLILIAQPMVRLIFGEGYLPGVIVIQVLAIYTILDSIVKVTGNGLDFLGRARERAIIKALTSILNVILNLILIPWFGVVGAAIATVCTYSIYTFFSMYIMYDEIEFDLRKIIDDLLAILICTASMAIVVYYIRHVIVGFTSLFGVIFIGVIVWGIVATAMGLISQDNISQLLG